MTSANDETVREAIRQIKSSKLQSTNDNAAAAGEGQDGVHHRVIVTTFLSHAAIKAIMKAYEEV